MTFRNASDRKLALWMAAAGIALGAALAGTLALCRLQHRAALAARSELAPDPVALRHRFSTASSTAAADTASTITALEARIEALASPFDYAELAELHLRRAQLDGDPEGYRIAEAMARKSLELLPTPNAAVLTLAKLADARHEFREAIDLAHRHKARSASAQIILATAHLAL